MKVPFFRPSLLDDEVGEVIQTLRSGWLTTGPRVKRFEEEFASAIAPNGNGHSSNGHSSNGHKSNGHSNGHSHKLHAVAVNSCTAALHLALEALGVKPGQRVLVPTMTFAATAEVVRYLGATPVLVDCDPTTLNMDLSDCESRIANHEAKAKSKSASSRTVGIMPVHVGGTLMDLDALKRFATKHKLWIVEDAAHAFPSSWLNSSGGWQHRSNGPKSVTCYSFYANKTITTGEGGMAVTSSAKLAQRMRLMSLHGLSADAWGRYTKNGSWDYRIVAPGYKYNLTDIAAAIGIHQLTRAEAMRHERETIAQRYLQELEHVDQIELPQLNPKRIESWHLFVIRLRLAQLRIDRDEFINELKEAGIGSSVHWRPLHLHPYYRRTFGYTAKDFPVASAEWKRLISMPIFPGMREAEIDHVVNVVRRICKRHAR